MDAGHAITRRRLVALGVAAAGARALGPLSPLGDALADVVPGGPRAASVVLRLPAARRIGPLAVPGGLELAGLRWPGRAHVHAELRARRRGGRWTEWLPLAQAGDHGPDGGGAGGTDPVWTGPASEVELRLSRPVAGLVLHGVRTSGARREIVSAYAAEPAPGAPPVRIITRAQWGSRAVPPRVPAEHGRVELAFVHHTVNANDYGRADSAAIVLAIARYHRDGNGWNDIGYNFLVDRFGQVFEGRNGGIEEAVIGAQAQGWNSVSTGIANLGTFGSHRQSAVAVDALSRLIAWKLTLHGVPVDGRVTLRSMGGADNRYRAGTRVSLRRISGHRDGCATDCPGNALYAQIPDVRRRAAAYARRYAPARLELFARDDVVVLPRPARLDGTLHRTSDGAPIAGATVTIEARAPRGGDWGPVGQVQTLDDGSFTASVPLARTSLVRARYTAGGVDVAGAHVPLSVVPSVRLSASAARVAPGASVALTVRCTPARPRVLVAVDRQVGRGRWVRLRTVRAHVDGDTATASVRLARAGAYRIEAVAQGGGGLDAGYSRPLVVRASGGAAKGRAARRRTGRRRGR